MGLSIDEYAMVFLAGSALVVTFLWPMRCNGRKSGAPYEPCNQGVHGILGHCRWHGRPIHRRVVASLGGRDLLGRRTCNACGAPRVLIRLSGDGTPALSCSTFPRCKNPKLLKNYGL